MLMINRFSWILASVAMGLNINYGNYMSTIVISFIALILFALGIIYKDGIISKFSRANPINS